MLNNSQLERWIWIANTGLALGALVASIYVALSPAQRGEMLNFVVEERRIEEIAGIDASWRPKPLEFYSPIWSWCIPPVPPPPPPHASLDTLISVQGVKQNSSDARRSCAFVTLLRTRECRRAYPGEDIEGAKVAAITGPGTVQFDYYGERVTLTLTR